MRSVPSRFYGALMSLTIVAMTVLLAIQGIAYLAENDLHYGLNLLIVVATPFLFLGLTRRYYVRMKPIVLGSFPIATLVLMNALFSLLHRAVTGEVPPAHDYSFLFILPIVAIALLIWGAYFDRVRNKLIRQ